MLPKSINVLGQKYKVLRKLPKKHEYLKDQVLGLFVMDDNYIYIDPELEGEKMWRVFFHEMKHAIDFRNGLDQAVPGELLELNCQAVGFSMAQFIMDMGWVE